jgi:hypothetical protein
VPCSADGGCQVIRTKWRHWGRSVATGRGMAKFNDCEPNCARGHFHKVRGARVRAYRLRGGTCGAQDVRYYTRVRINWPKRLHFRARTMKLKASCPADASPAQAHASAWISIAYGKRVLRRYINKKYTVVRGPYFSNCTKTRSNKVRCDIDFRAGLFARCARGWVRNSGGYDYITLRAPIC